MKIDVAFSETERKLDLNFGEVIEVSGNGYEQGLSEGYANGKADGLTEGYAEGEEAGYKSGYETGYTKGDADGQAKGKAEGLTEGYAKGETAGYDKGYSEGEEKGHTDGYSTGKAEGYAEGQEIGYNSGYAQGNTDGYATGKTDGERIGYESGYEQGNTDGKAEGESIGYADALAKRTELTITENGDYTPTGESTGFKSVIVAVEPPPSEIDALIDKSIKEVSSGVKSIEEYALYKCQNLISANFPNATNIEQYAFGYCRKLTSADFPNVKSIGNYALKGCEKLTSANFPNATSIGSDVFYGCYALTSVNIPNATSISISMFSSCTKLTSIDLPNATSIGMGAFTNCYLLKSVILRSETMCTLSNINAFSTCFHIIGKQNSTYNPNGDKDGYIYVPSHLVEQYRQATNWSTYASQIVAIPEEGGSTGGWTLSDFASDYDAEQYSISNGHLYNVGEPSFVKDSDGNTVSGEFHSETEPFDLSTLDKTKTYIIWNDIGAHVAAKLSYVE